MSVAERPAFSNLSTILGSIHLTILTGVVGMLVVMVPPMPAMTTDLLIFTVLISLYIQPPVDLAVFPLLLLALTQVRPTFLPGYVAAAGKRIQSFGQSDVGNCFAGIIIFLVLIAILCAVTTRASSINETRTH